MADSSAPHPIEATRPPPAVGAHGTTNPDGAAWPTRYWTRLDDGRVQCDVCPRECALHNGQRGVCFVRARHGDEIVLTTYGRSSGFCIDPIEKKPLHHFLPGTPVFSFGTAGCNLACRFCQNWDISKSKQDDTLADAASPAAIAETAAGFGCRSVAFTYNDPTVFLEYAIDVAEECRARGLATIAVTAGYINPKPRADLFAHIDAANVDLKGFTDDFYRHTCGARLAPVLDTIEYLVHDTPVWVELTTLLIPGRNDSDDEIAAMTRWVVDHLGTQVPWHFSAFHPDFRMRDVPPTTAATLGRARAIAQDHGVEHAFTGNLHDPDGGSSWCSACGGLLIGRDRYELHGWHVVLDRDGLARCRHCNARLDGRFEDRPGEWGRKRRPVAMHGSPHVREDLP